MWCVTEALAGVAFVLHQMLQDRCVCRRPISEIRKQFPGVDFSLITADEDVLWKKDEREQHNAMRVRNAMLFI